MKYFLRSLLIGLLCLAPLSTDATQRVAALISPQAINVDVGFVQVGNVGNLSVMGAPSGATFSLLTNPGGHFSIVGTEIVADPSTPAGQYSLSVQASGTGYSVTKTFVLNFSGVTPPTPHFFQGANLSGMESIPPSLPPSIAQVSYFVSNNISNFRLPINWINIQPTINTALDPTYVASLHTALANIHAAGGVATIDVHNFGNCPNGVPIGGGCAVSAFVDLWTRIVTEFGSDAGLYGIDLMNEWVNGFPFQTLFDAQQQAITAIRGLGYAGFIYVEGTAFTGTWNWVSGQGNAYNNNLLWQLVDPLNKTKFEGHMYYDRDNSGTHFSYAIESASPGFAPPGTSTNPTIGVMRLTPWVQWGAQNNVTLNYGEGGVSSDAYGLGGNLNFTAWNVMLDNAIAVAKANNIEYWYWGNGPGFGQGFLGTTLGYGYNSEPFSSTDLTSKDYTTAGVQAPQMAVLRRSAGSTQPQPIAYALVRPLLVTSSGNPERPNIAPINYFTPSVASAPFQIYYGGEIPAPVTITPHDTLMDGTSAGGTFTPATVTLAAGENALVAFTYTPSQAATIRISTTNNVGWIDPPALGISSQTDNYVDVPANQLGPIYGAYNRYTPNIGPAYRLQRSTDGQQKDFYYTVQGSTGYLGLDRGAIQTWASARSGITVIREYDQSPARKHLNFNQAASFLGSISGTTLTTQLSSGALAIGQTIVDDALKVIPGTKIISGSGTTWTVDTSQNVSTEAMFTVNTVGVTLATMTLANGAGYPEVVFPTNAQGTFTGPFVGKTQMSIIARFNQNVAATAGLFRTDHFTGPVAWSNANIQFSRTGWVGQAPLTSAVLLATTNLNITNGTYGDYGYVYNANSATGHKTYKNGSVTASQTSVLSSFTGTSSGTSITAASVTGSILPTDGLYGGCAPAGTYIVSQNAGGTPGGAGTYVTSQPTTCAGDALQTSSVMNPGFSDGTTTFGWFQFSAVQKWVGTYTNLEFIAGLALNDTQVASVMSTDVTYYSTPLPDTLPALAPTISGAQANQAIFPGFITARPFSAMVVQDQNSGGPTDTVTITLSGAAGTLSGTGISGSGPYTIGPDTPANVTTALQGATFTTAAGTGSVTNFSVAVASSAGTNATDNATSTVVSTYAAETPFAAPVGTFTPVNMKGVNLSGGENTPTPIWAQNFQIDYFASKGLGMIRLPASSQGFYTTAFGILSSSPINSIKGILDRAFTHNMYVVIDLRGFPSPGVWDSRISAIRSVVPGTVGEDLFFDVVRRLATLFKNYPNVMFGLMNEPFQTTAAQWQSSAAGAVNIIRTAGATQMIMIPGTALTGADGWVASGNGAAWAGYTGDTANNHMFEVHQYLDAGNSGSNAIAVVGKGASVLVAATNWARTNGVQLFLGEGGFAPDPWSGNPASNMQYLSGATPITTHGITEGTAMWDYMSANADVWGAWTYWSAGDFPTAPNANGYAYGVDPQFAPGGGYVMPIVDQPQMPVLTNHLFLLKRDLDPSSNDNDPMWLEKAA